jgi:DNA primase
MSQPTHERLSEQIRQLKEVCPIEVVVGQYFTLDAEGRRYLRAREHDSLIVDRWRGRYHWNARGESGDVVDFLRRQEGLSVLEAVVRLGGHVRDRPAPLPNLALAARPPLNHPRHGVPSRPHGRRMLRALRVAVDVYHAALLGDPTALAYLTSRGIDEPAIRRLRLGFCDGTRLVAACARANVSRRDAYRVGLLTRRPPSSDDPACPPEASPGREFLAGRVVIPEIGPAGPIWLIGRALPDARGPRYLSLPLTKPLLGYHLVQGSPIVLVVEGVFDLLTLTAWGLPGVALCGTDPSPRALDQLRRLARTRRVYLVPQADPPGQRSAARLAALLSEPPPIIPLPPGAKDLGDLAVSPAGRAAFLRALPPEVAGHHVGSARCDVT